MCLVCMLYVCVCCICIIYVYSVCMCVHVYGMYMYICMSMLCGMCKYRKITRNTETHKNKMYNIENHSSEGDLKSVWKL